MQVINGANALEEDTYNEVYGRIVPVREIAQKCFGGLAPQMEQYGQFFYTPENSSQIKLKNHGRSLVSELDKGNLVWVCNTDNLHSFENNNIQQNSAIGNIYLKHELAKLQDVAYTLQTENVELKWKLQEFVLAIEEKEVSLMHIYKLAPFKQLGVMAGLFMLIGLLCLFASVKQLGTFFIASCFATGFIASYLLWEIHGIAVLRPQFSILSFLGSVLLMLVSILSIIYN